MKDKNKKKEKPNMSFWGVGPLYGLFNIFMFIPALYLTFAYPKVFRFSFLPIVLYVISVCLIIFGLYLWISAGRQIDNCILKGVLATNGVYGIVRNPIYSGILFVVSGICFACQSWLLLILIPISYLFLIFILRNEDVILTEVFGEEYIRYKNRVNSVLPKFTSIYAAFFYPVKTQKITNNLFAVKDRDVNFFVYKTESKYICFDTGYGSDKAIEGLSNLGISNKDIEIVFLTHSDPDHSKGLRLFPSAKLYFGKDELPLVNGKKKRIGIFYSNPKIDREYYLLDDNQIIIIDGTKVKTIYTKGHTIGHVCYLINNEILITGDSVIYQNGFIKPFYRPFSMIHRKTIASAQKIMEVKGEFLICTAHTGLVYKKTKS